MTEKDEDAQQGNWSEKRFTTFCRSHLKAFQKDISADFRENNVISRFAELMLPFQKSKVEFARTYNNQNTKTKRFNNPYLCKDDVNLT